MTLYCNPEDVDVPTTETDTDAVFESVDIKPPRPTSQLHKKINKTSSLPPQTTAEDSIEEEEEEDYGELSTGTIDFVLMISKKNVLYFRGC